MVQDRSALPSMDKRRSLFVLMIVLFLFSACGSQETAVVPSLSPPTEAPPSLTPTSIPPTHTPQPTATVTLTPTPSQADLLLPAAQSEGQLNVIALPHDWMNFGEIISVFSHKYGIAVKELDPNAGSSTELKAIRNGRITGDPLAPDVIDVGVTFAMQAKAENLLLPYQVSTWSSIPDSAKDPDGYWYGDYYGIIVFEINPDFVLTMPEDWSDLLKPEYNVALTGLPAVSYQSMMSVYSASLANGGSLNDTLPGLRFFQQINRNKSLSDVIARRDTILSGETPIALRWDYLALADREALAGQKEIVIVIPKTGLVAGMYAQAISAYAPHPNAAKLWMEFLYSDEGQLLLLKGLGHPIRFADLVERGVVPDSLLNRLLRVEPYLEAEFPTGEQLNAADRSILSAWSIYVP
jgi:putative spermidine/putrescine transport system substrate-binding protein